MEKLKLSLEECIQLSFLIIRNETLAEVAAMCLWCAGWAGPGAWGHLHGDRALSVGQQAQGEGAGKAQAWSRAGKQGLVGLPAVKSAGLAARA